jgi:uncharacterized protein (DUF1919 family)
MTLEEVQELMPERKIVPFVDGMYLAFPKKQETEQETEQEWEQRKKRIEECFSIGAKENK